MKNLGLFTFENLKWFVNKLRLFNAQMSCGHKIFLCIFIVACLGKYYDYSSMIRTFYFLFIFFFVDF